MTEHGHPVALLTPIPLTGNAVLDEFEAEGLLEQRVTRRTRPLPEPAPRLPGEAPISELIIRDREEDWRWHGLYTDSSALVKLVIREADSDHAAWVPPPALRSLDALHVASASAMRDSLDALVTYDRRMIDAGRLAGLRVVSPGDKSA